jgi:hypothetical protein
MHYVAQSTPVILTVAVPHADFVKHVLRVHVRRLIVMILTTVRPIIVIQPGHVKMRCYIVLMGVHVKMMVIRARRTNAIPTLMSAYIRLRVRRQDAIVMTVNSVQKISATPTVAVIMS